MNFERVENYVEGKKIIDFKKGEIIYIQKGMNGFNHIFECKFISYEHGIVTAEIVSCDCNWIRIDMEFPTRIIRAKPCKCYLWGKDKNPSAHMGHPYCHWCKDGVFK